MMIIIIIIIIIIIGRLYGMEFVAAGWCTSK